MTAEKNQIKIENNVDKNKNEESNTNSNNINYENVVLIGQKPVMRYVVACLTSFNAGGKKVIVKARGKAISKAVDTAELLRRAFAKDVEIEKIEIGTEEMDRPDRPRSNVSTMEIVLVKNRPK